MKKKFLCLFLGIWLCLSFSLPLYALDGPINADDDAELVRPTLEMTTIPTGAAAVGRSLILPITYYYRINGDMLLDPNTPLSEPGSMPDAYSPNGVIPDGNDRELVDSTLDLPYSAIAYIESTFPNGKICSGTATMISSNAALTAAHNLYCPAYDGWATSVKVTPGAYGASFLPVAPFGYSMAIEAVISVPAFEDGNEEDGVNCDWGLLRLSDPVGINSRFLGFQYVARSMGSEENGLSVTISGYPGDLNDDDSTVNQYKQSGMIESDVSTMLSASNNIGYENRIVSYEIDATKGQSGAPILYFNNGSYQIVGVHSSEKNSITGICYKNQGCALTSSMFSFLLAYKNNS